MDLFRRQVRHISLFHSRVLHPNAKLTIPVILYHSRCAGGRTKGPWTDDDEQPKNKTCARAETGEEDGAEEAKHAQQSAEDDEESDHRALGRPRSGPAAGPCPTTTRGEARSAWRSAIVWPTCSVNSVGNRPRRWRAWIAPPGVHPFWLGTVVLRLHAHRGATHGRPGPAPSPLWAVSDQLSWRAPPSSNW